MFPDLIEYLWIGWLVLVIVLVVIELLTLEFTFLMIAGGSLIGGLGANLLGLEWWVQVAAAAAISALLLFTIRPLLLRTLRRGGDPTPSNVEALYGLGARVMRDFHEGAGTVKLDNGETWSSRIAPASAASVPREGDRVIVTRILGSIAEIAPVPASPPVTPSVSDVSEEKEER